MKPKLLFLIVLLLLPAFVISGCNIFGWTSGESTDSLIDEGKELMREANYSAAAAKFAEAMAEDPNSSDARYYHAKATLRAAGYNALSLAKTISEGSFSDGDALPFTDSTWTIARANNLYQAMKTIRDDLNPVYHNNTTGNFDSLDIDLDFGLAGAFVGVLSFRDSDFDGAITVADPDLGVTYQGGASSGFAVTNLVDYFNAFSPKLAGGLAPDSIAIPAQAITNFNNLIDFIVAVINECRAIIIDIIDRHDSELDVDEINDVLNEIVALVGKYKVADGINNDPDNLINGNPDVGIDEEIIDGIDNDGDGMIDEDSNGYTNP